MSRHVSSWQSPAWQLLGVLCKPETSPAEAEAAAAWRAQVRDWPFFLKLAAHHRVRPLVVKGAARLGVSLPEVVQDVLREEAIVNAREAFRYLAELQKLLALLSSAGVQATVLKGVPLSAIAYGDVGIREVGDIDLLIDPADALTADAVLSQSGLVRKEPAGRLTPRRRDFYAKFFKDYTYEPKDRTDSGFEVDLHWRLLRDAVVAQRILPSALADGGRTRLCIGSLAMDVLNRERCLLYLAVHGATEGWARRKSLADVAALWAGCTEDERRWVCLTAEQDHCAAFLYSALRLAEEWMGPLPGFPCAERTTESSRYLQNYIVDHARRRMFTSDGMPSPAGETTVAMKWHEARLYPARSSRQALVMRVLFRPRIWETIDLPDAFFFLYPFLSPLEWVAFRGRRWMSRIAKTGVKTGANTGANTGAKAGASKGKQA